MNICKEIKCPYYRDESPSGCQYYATAFGCHFIDDGDGGDRLDGFEQTNAYAIYAESANGLKERNEDFFRTDPIYLSDISSLERLKAIGKKYPNRIL